MNYEIQTENGYIMALVTYGNEEAFSKEYLDICDAIKRRPSDAPSGFDYKLRVDTLEWELVELPPMLEDNEITAEEALEIIRGGAV